MTQSERDTRYQARQKHTQPVKWTRLHSGRRHLGRLLSPECVQTTACRSSHHDMTQQRQRSSEGMQTERVRMKRGWDTRGSGPASMKLNVNGRPVVWACSKHTDKLRGRTAQRHGNVRGDGKRVCQDGMGVRHMWVQAGEV